MIILLPHSVKVVYMIEEYIYFLENLGFSKSLEYCPEHFGLQLEMVTNANQKLDFRFF